MHPLEVQHLVMPSVVMIGQTDEGSRQSHQAHPGQKKHDEDQGLVHFGQAQLRDCALPIPVESHGLPIARAEGNRSQAQADHRAGRDYRSAKCSHRRFSDLKARCW